MPELRRHRGDRLAKAVSHPLRVRILLRLTYGGVASPSELAEALGEPTGSSAPTGTGRQSLTRGRAYDLILKGLLEARGSRLTPPGVES